MTPTSAAVSGANIGSGTNPTATATAERGERQCERQRQRRRGRGGVQRQPGGGATFNSSGAYVDVIAAGSGLTSSRSRIATSTAEPPCPGGRHGLGCSPQPDVRPDDQLRHHHGEHHHLAHPQPDDRHRVRGRQPADHDGGGQDGRRPALHRGHLDEPIGHCHVHLQRERHATAPVTRASDGQNQSASGTCTDGVGQKAATTFTGINVDKTPPTCAIVVTPTVLWPPNGKPVAITGTATAGDTLSGRHVVGGAVTSNEALARRCPGLRDQPPFATPLQLSAVVNLAGTLEATRAGDGSGRTYTQTVTVTDQAGNTNTTPCTWTVSVPHDRAVLLKSAYRRVHLRLVLQR